MVVVVGSSSEVELKWETKEDKRKKKAEKREDKGGQECNQVGFKKGKAESENCNRMEMRSNHEKEFMFGGTPQGRKEEKKNRGGVEQRTWWEEEEKSVNQIITRNSKYYSTPI